jgi:molybdopterin synthase catalytic subunit
VTSVGVVRTAIDPAEVLARVGAPDDGAVLLFLGTVRDHADGRAVEGLHYEAYEAMAREVLAAIAAEAAARLRTERIAVVHRVGELAIGDVSVAIAVSSPHRAEAYDASRYVIEEIKKRLPVWKHERYAEGDAGWVRGHDLAGSTEPR